MQPERAGREGDSQPLPTTNNHEYVQAVVCRDIMARMEVGIKRYGTGLQPFNGRDALRDAYEEVLDLACYLRQLLIEDEMLPVPPAPPPRQRADELKDWEKYAGQRFGLPDPGD